ncbi:hypothetical protein CL618_00500 [archaeon]|nr:hypothetical protein [archaeon]|tara:strand:- start:790 stop:1236 length:447 start_codon:yes stop_codon:yes gene_type:complete
MDKKLIQKIKQQLNKKKNFESIKMSLLNSDYTLKEIEEAFKEIKKVKKTKKPLFISTYAEQFSSYYPIASALLLILSSFLYYKTKIDLSNCATKISSLKPGVMKFLGITIFQGTQCDSLNIKSILFLIVMILTIITTIYLVYDHFKNN